MSESRTENVKEQNRAKWKAFKAEGRHRIQIQGWEGKGVRKEDKKKEKDKIKTDKVSARSLHGSNRSTPQRQ